MLARSLRPNLGRRRRRRRCRQAIARRLRDCPVELIEAGRFSDVVEFRKLAIDHTRVDSLRWLSTHTPRGSSARVSRSDRPGVLGTTRVHTPRSGCSRSDRFARQGVLMDPIERRSPKASRASRSADRMVASHLRDVGQNSAGASSPSRHCHGPTGSPPSLTSTRASVAVRQ